LLIPGPNQCLRYRALAGRADNPNLFTILAQGDEDALFTGNS